VREILSIQVHPSKMEAEKGFAFEEQMNIPLDASHRNYKDQNHKPEVLVALSEFWLLHGFKQKEKITAALQSIPSFKSLEPYFAGGNYKALYEYVMKLPQNEVNEILHPLITQSINAVKNNTVTKELAAYWVAKIL